MLIRPATFADVDAVVSIHRAALPGDVAPSFGPRFLGRFYRRLIESPDQHLLVSSDDDVDGFCAVSMRPAPLIGSLRPADVAYFATRVVRSPRLIARTVLQARRPAVADWDRRSEVAFVAVDQRSAGQGHGTALIRAATTLVADAGRDLVVTKTANTRFAEFYRRELGAAVVDRFTALGQTYVVLEWPSGRGSQRAATVRR